MPKTARKKTSLNRGNLISTQSFASIAQQQVMVPESQSTQPSQSDIQVEGTSSQGHIVSSVPQKKRKLCEFEKVDVQDGEQVVDDADALDYLTNSLKKVQITKAQADPTDQIDLEQLREEGKITSYFNKKK